MSPQAHQTARTAIWVVGGLMGLSLVGGVVAFVLVADKATNAMNNANNQVPQPQPIGPAVGTQGYQINPQLGG